MKRLILSIAVSTVSLWTLPLTASDTETIHIGASPTDHRPTKMELATNACFDAFIGEILPDSNFRVRTVITDDQREFSGPLVSKSKLYVEMKASRASTGEVVAKGRCLATPRAKVSYLKTKILNEELLTSLTPSEIRFVASTR